MEINSIGSEIVTESESVQPLLSVKVYEYMPAYKESGFTTPPQSCV